MVTINAHRKDQCVYCGHQTCQIRTTTDMHGGVVSTLERITTHQQGTSCLGQKVRACRGTVMAGRQKLPRSVISGPPATHDFVAFSLLSNLQPLLTADCSSLVIQSTVHMHALRFACSHGGVQRTSTADRPKVEGDQAPASTYTSMGRGVRQVTEWLHPFDL
jgi:hypothetical protein